MIHEPPRIEEMDLAWQQSPDEMDRRWSEGWRHFGPHFFRYSYGEVVGHRAYVWPLRLDLTAWQPKKSQRRVLKKNADTEVTIQDITIDAERERLFDEHKQRFTDNVPSSLSDFLGPQPGLVPCQTREIAVTQGDRLLAASYLDLGESSASSVYGFFDPQESHRSLGIFTMLVEMLWTQQQGFRWYYPGYAYDRPSIYDYKKNFTHLQRYDWAGQWIEMPEGFHATQDPT